MLRRTSSPVHANTSSFFPRGPLGGLIGSQSSSSVSASGELLSGRSLSVPSTGGSMSVPSKGASLTPNKRQHAPASRGEPQPQIGATLRPANVLRPSGEFQTASASKFSRSVTPPAPVQSKTLTAGETPPTAKTTGIGSVSMPPAIKMHPQGEMQAVPLTAKASATLTQTMPTPFKMPLSLHQRVAVAEPHVTPGVPLRVPSPVSASFAAQNTQVPSPVNSPDGLTRRRGHRTPSPDMIRLSGEAPVVSHAATFAWEQRSPSPDVLQRTNVSCDVPAKLASIRRRSPDMLTAEGVAGYTQLQQQIASLDYKLNSTVSRCNVLEQEFAKKHIEQTKRFAELESRLRCQKRELEKKIPDGSASIETQVEALGIQLAEQIQGLGSELSAKLDVRLKEMLDQELAIDADVVQKISDHVITRVNEDPRICQVVDSHKSLHESFSRLSSLLEKASPSPAEWSPQGHETSVTALHEMVMESEKNTKAMSVELRQMRQRRNQDFSANAVRFDYIENKFSHMQGKVEEWLTALNAATSENELVKILGNIPMSLPDPEPDDSKHETLITEDYDEEEETDGDGNN